MRAARTWAAALVVVLALTLAAVAGTAGAGHAAPTTLRRRPRSRSGSSTRAPACSPYGAQYRQGLTLGMQYVTKGTNRINGRPVQVTYVDDAGDPAKAVTAARDLIGQGYKIIAGSTSSGAAVQVARSRRRTACSSSAAPRRATRSRLNRYTFRAGRQSTQDVLAAKGILGRSTGRRVVVFAQDSVFGQGNVAAVRAILGGAGHRSRRSSCRSRRGLHAVRAAREPDEPDLLFVAWAGTTAPAMWRALEQQGTIRGTTVATGLAERATGKLRPRAELLALRRRGAEEQGQHLAQARMKRTNQVPDIFTPDGS